MITCQVGRVIRVDCPIFFYYFLFCNLSRSFHNFCFTLKCIEEAKNLFFKLLRTQLTVCIRLCSQSTETAIQGTNMEVEGWVPNTSAHSAAALTQRPGHARWTLSSSDVHPRLNMTTAHLYQKKASPSKSLFPDLLIQMISAKC